MKQPEKLRRLKRRYAAALRTYAAEEREAVLETAYELGRAAIRDGLGILDLARIHRESREKLLRADTGGKNRERISKAAATFFLQALSPFEATHRGFCETTVELQKRNRELEAEMAERRRAEKALHASEARLRAILDHSPAVIFLKDTQGRYLHVNRQFERQFGLDRSQVAGRTDRDIFPREQASHFQNHDREVLDSGVPLEFEETAHYRNGMHTSIVSKFPLRDAKGRIYALCGVATDITERKRAEEALKNLSRKVLEAQEKERQRVSRELHDEVGQSLTAISVTLASLRNNGATKSEHLARTIVDTQRLLEGTMEAVHRFARELRPAMLDELGLLPALRSHVKNFSERTGLRVGLHAEPAAEKLNGEQKTTIFRVAQESLTNVARHAHASRVNIFLRRAGDGICLEIADNGKSFRADPATASRQKQRLGLLGMQERVRLVNGRFEIQPEPGRGTTVRVTIPFCEHGLETLTRKGGAYE
jgi:PAS domain S-box-containing protein